MLGYHFTAGNRQTLLAGRFACCRCEAGGVAVDHLLSSLNFFARDDQMLAAAACGQEEAVFLEEEGDFTVRLDAEVADGLTGQLDKRRGHLVVGRPEERQIAREARARSAADDFPARASSNLAEDQLGGVEAVRFLRQGHAERAVRDDVIEHEGGAEVVGLGDLDLRIGIRLRHLVGGGDGIQAKTSEGQECQDGFHV